MSSFRELLASREDWLMERVLGYARTYGYTRYTSTQVCDWRLSIAGLTRALLAALDVPGGLPEPGVDDGYVADPAADFAITEARRHRERGISPALFLGLFSYYRRGYLDLVEESDLPAADKAAALAAVQLFFERVGIAVAVEWSGLDRDRHLAALEATNRALTNEKNRYFTLFESLDRPVFVLDAESRIVTCNTSAVEWLMLTNPPYAGSPDPAPPASCAWRVSEGVASRPIRDVLPDFAEDIAEFASQGQSHSNFEKTLLMQGRKACYKVSLARMLDYGQNFHGMLVVVEDVTVRRSAEEALQLDHLRLGELVRQNLQELEQANAQLRKEAHDRELAEEAMRQGAQFYRAVVEDQTELICRFTSDGRLTFVNKAYSRFFDRDQNDLVGRSLAEFLPEDERRQVFERIATITQQNPVLELEHRVLAPDGSARWRHWTNRGIFDLAGNITEFQAVGSDITERKQAELALTELNETLERKVEDRTRDATQRAEKITRINAELREEVSRRQAAEEDLRKRLAMEEILSEASSRFINLLPEGLDQGIEEALGVLGNLLDVDRSYVFRIKGRTMSNTHEWCSVSTPPQKDNLQDLPLEMFPWWMDQLWSFQTVVVSDVDQLPPGAEAEKATFLGQDIKSLLGVPLVLAGNLLGFIGFDAVREKRVWRAEDVTVLETFARILVGALESRRMEDALRDSEQRHRELVENLSEGIIRVDGEGRVSFANRSMGSMLGYAPEEMLGRSAYDFLSPESRDAVRMKLKERREGKSDQYESEMLHRQGSKVYVRISGSPVRDAQGVVTGSMALITDITRQKYMQAQLLQAQKLESIGQLAAGIAHEINTPTQYVANNTQFLAQAFSDVLGMCESFTSLAEKAKRGEDCGSAVAGIEAEMERVDVAFLKEEIPRAIAESQEGLERIATIVRSVKHFAHPVGATKQLEDLNAAVRSAVTVSTNEWKYVAEMTMDLDQGLPQAPCVLGEINQVVLNLITNAAHAIAEAQGEKPEEKGRITVSTRSDGDWVEVRVADTGRGIPQAIRSRIFDPFFTTKPVGQGTGQGLAISHTIVVEKHGGSIGFETEEGRGTTFIVRLPLQEEPAP